MSLLFSIFTIAIYRPFFNLLVAIYLFLGLGSAEPDMGIAVIILTLIIRILLLPLSLAGSKSEPQRREVTKKLKELEKEFAQKPHEFKKARKKLFGKNRRLLIAELVSLGIQVITALMLFRIFKTGLEGKDLHLLYDFMPKVSESFNLEFLGRFDLSRSSLTLNLVQSLSIFIFETVAAITSPYPYSRAETVRLQFTLPVVSFFIFLFLPAGKKLFVITTLLFSTALLIAKYVYKRFAVEEKQASS